MFGKYKVNLKAITPVFIANGKSYTHSEFLHTKVQSGEKKYNSISRYDIFDFYKNLPVYGHLRQIKLYPYSLILF